jgi:hypothetical protein
MNRTKEEEPTVVRQGSTEQTLPRPPLSSNHGACGLAFSDSVLPNILANEAARHPLQDKGERGTARGWLVYRKEPIPPRD